MTAASYLAWGLLELPLQICLVKALRKMGATWLIPAENAESLRRHLKKYGAWLIPILIPGAVAEELLFRGPAWVCKSWALGVLSSALFAKMHGMRGRVFPLPQFLGGLWLWFGAIRFGWWYAVASHTIFNSLAFLLCLRSLKNQAAAAGGGAP